MTTEVMRSVSGVSEDVQKQAVKDVLKLDDNYTIGTRLYWRHCEENGYGLFDGIIPYVDYLETEHEGRRFAARTYNVRIAAVKHRIRYVLEKYGKKLTSDDILKFEKILKSIRPKKVHNVHAKQVASIDEIRTLIQEASVKDRKLAPMIKFLFVTGVRVSEMLNILRSDINMSKKGPYAHIRILGKGRKERTVYVDKRLVREIIATYRSKTYLFEHYSPTEKKRIQYSRNSVTKRIKACSAGCNITEISAHGLRHSYATHLLNDKNIPVRKVADLMGHSSTAVTDMIYNGVTASPEDAQTDLEI